MQSHRVLAIGEALIDLIATEETESVAQARTFSRQAGGAPANVAVAVAKLGGQSEYLGALGSDPFGDFLMDTLTAYGVHTEHVMRVVQATSLAFVGRSHGESQYYFVRSPGADTQLDVAHVASVPITAEMIVHVGSNSLAVGPLREAVQSLLKRAKTVEALISFDVNLRRAFWSDDVDPLAICQTILPLVDVLKVNRDELLWLMPADDEHTAIMELARSTPAVIVSTLGSHGVLLYRQGWEQPLEVASRTVPVLDTTGAGDAFMGALLYGLAEEGISHAGLLAMDGAQWLNLCAFATAAAALTVGKIGAMSALPSLQEVNQLLPIVR